MWRLKNLLLDVVVVVDYCGGSFVEKNLVVMIRVDLKSGCVEEKESGDEGDGLCCLGFDLMMRRLVMKVRVRVSVWGGWWGGWW